MKSILFKGGGRVKKNAKTGGLGILTNVLRQLDVHRSRLALPGWY